ncbi:MAG: ribbon-helix-helix protein, CopG family [Gammaproteobacteria bacterium]|nr:ribbon-helix-helix protein, CopG family [Gammaproteobacteria bacterium]MYK29841.1 ribbon-helix-helix protein, CopG family [Gammaproteobacteria bacterium]
MGSRARSWRATGIVVGVATEQDCVIAVKIIRIALDDNLLARVDARAQDLGLTRSAFAKGALLQALRQLDELELERRQIAGYRETPSTPTEFDVPEVDHAWGDSPWSAA